jgi:hypothetical protein
VRTASGITHFLMKLGAIAYGAELC